MTNQPINLKAPTSNGLRITDESSGILGILESKGFLKELKRQFLGLRFDRNLKQEVPIQLRRLTKGSDERVDQTIKELELNCSNCGWVNQIRLTCPYCGKNLTDNQCTEHKVIDKPMYRCNHCLTVSDELRINEVNYTNDSAIMNESGANKIITFLKLNSNPVSSIGSTKEFKKILDQRSIIFELQVMVDNNKDNFGIKDENLECIKASVVRYINSLFDLVVSDNPASFLERITKIVNEVNQTVKRDDEGGSKLP